MTHPLHLHPLDEVAIDPVIAALPKADIHLHQEWSPRLDRVLARRASTPRRCDSGCGRPRANR